MSLCPVLSCTGLGNKSLHPMLWCTMKGACAPAL